MIRQLSYAAVALLLASCSTVLDGQIQEVTIETTGASNTLCYMQNRDFSFRFYPPQTLKVSKSSDAYTIRCLAPGNREKTIVVEPEVSDNAYFNVANAGVGAGLDHLSSAMYVLPSKIVINFDGVMPTPYAQPHYNELFDQNPHLKGVEEFRPGQSALIRDAQGEVPALKKREGVEEGANMTPLGASPLDTGVQSAGDQSAAAPVVTHVAPPVPSTSGAMSAEDLTRTMNPQVFSGSR
ncbi:MAG TPA: hypothetical protein VGD95_07985 [Micavibrio sp.]